MLVVGGAACVLLLAVAVLLSRSVASNPNIESLTPEWSVDCSCTWRLRGTPAEPASTAVALAEPAATAPLKLVAAAAAARGGEEEEGLEKSAASGEAAALPEPAALDAAEAAAAPPTSAARADAATDDER